MGAGVTDEQMSEWVKENETNFADLKEALGVKLSLHPYSYDVVWPDIHAAIGEAVLVHGRVIVVPTKKKA